MATSQRDFPMFRITLLGAGGVGKTSVINSFVNRGCPGVHASTHFPQLYYRVVRLSDEGDKESRKRSLCVELEDTFPSTLVDPNRDIRRHMDMKRKTLALPSGQKDFTPFGLWSVPLVPMLATEKFQPITHGRMGFLIVFDVNDEQTFVHATMTHQVVKEMADARDDTLNPIVFLVANKIDRLQNSTTQQNVITKAEAYAQKEFMRLWKVSALQAKNVHKMFRDMLYRISGNELLWQLEVEEESSEEETEENCSVM